jgi:serine/threonine-protein kinase
MPIPDQVLNGVYRLEAQLGEGGMGTIWRARHEALGRPCAVKFLREGFDTLDRSERTERFLREAKLVASIQSRFVVSLFDFGSTPEGELFMVMELLAGRTLEHRLAEPPGMPLRETARVIGLALAGLQAVHERGIVHRDLKPDNVFLVEDADGCFPKIIDFGISRPVGRSGRGRALTRAGLTMGTPHYMAPEQVRGDPDIDGRADLYTLGIVLFKAATGRLPHEAENVLELLVKVASEPAADPFALRPEMGKAFADVIARSLARDRKERFASAAAMRAALDLAAATLPKDLPSLWTEASADGAAVPEAVPSETFEDEPAVGVSNTVLAQTPPEGLAGTLAIGSGRFGR